jgi:hypothetical protein
MSPATVAITVEGVLLALALLFVVALLRSHAQILRRLAALEPEPEAAAGAVAGGRSGRIPAVAPVSDIAGQSLSGDAIKIALGPGSPATLLAFLGSGCAACGPLWAGLHEPIALPFDARLVVVTKGPDRERLARLLELAPASVDVVMSTAAWEAFAIPATPHFVLVGADGAIAGRGSAASWQQIATLLRDARDDGEIHRARTTAERAARAEQALAAAGITAGHPSLYPSGQQPPEPS